MDDEMPPATEYGVLHEFEALVTVQEDGHAFPTRRGAAVAVRYYDELGRGCPECRGRGPIASSFAR